MNGKGQKFTIPKFSKPKSPTRIVPIVPYSERDTPAVRGLKFGIARAGTVDARRNMAGFKVDSDSGEVFSGVPSTTASTREARALRPVLEKLSEEKIRQSENRKMGEEDVNVLKKLVGRGGELTKIESVIKKLRKKIKK
jgi:hypothetical protein